MRRFSIFLMAAGLMVLVGCGNGDSGKNNPRLQQALERLTAATTPQERFSILGEAAKQSLAAGKATEAGNYAQELLDLLPGLRTQSGAGDAAMDAHQVLGRIALRAGQVDDAKQHLLESIKIPGPRMMDYGPSMSLVKDLLEKGERQAVLDYFSACGKFWDRNRLNEWTQEVQQGKAPDFPPNLLN